MYATYTSAAPVTYTAAAPYGSMPTSPSRRSVITAPAQPKLAPLALTPARALAEIDTTADDGGPAGLVLVVTPRSTGSALVVDDAGHLLTAWHVVAGFSKVSVWLKAPGDASPDQGRPLIARVARANRQSDLALLVLEDEVPGLVPLKLANSAALKRGEPVHVLGHAGGDRWAYSIARFIRLKARHSWVSQGRFVLRC